MAEDKVAAVSEWCSVGVDIWTGGVAAHGEDYDDAAGVERKVSSSNHRSDGQGGDCRPDIRFNQIDKGEKIEVGGARFEETRSEPGQEGAFYLQAPVPGRIGAHGCAATWRHPGVGDSGKVAREVERNCKSIELSELRVW